PGFERITQKELDWFKRNIGDEFLVVAKGVDRVLAQGVEAFGYFHDGLVTLAELGEVGTTYHEAFHFVVETVLTPEQREKILNAASKYYGIKRGPIEGGPRLRAVDYQLKVNDILVSDKAIQWFKKRDKAQWQDDQFWTKLQQDLQIPKEQVELLKSLNVENPYNREELITSLLANYSYTIEINTAKKKEVPTKYYSNLTVPGGTNYTENEIATPAITPSIKGHAQFSTDKGIGWFRSDDKTITEKAVNKAAMDAFGLEDENESSILKEVGTSNTRRILEIQSDLFQK